MISHANCNTSNLITHYVKNKTSIYEFGYMLCPDSNTKVDFFFQDKKYSTIFVVRASYMPSNQERNICITKNTLQRENNK